MPSGAELRPLPKSGEAVRFTILRRDERECEGQARHRIRHRCNGERFADEAAELRVFRAAGALDRGNIPSCGRNRMAHLPLRDELPDGFARAFVLQRHLALEGIELEPSVEDLVRLVVSRIPKWEFRQERTRGIPPPAMNPLCDPGGCDALVCVACMGFRRYVFDVRNRMIADGIECDDGLENAVSRFLAKVRAR